MELRAENKNPSAMIPDAEAQTAGDSSCTTVSPMMDTRNTQEMLSMVFTVGNWEKWAGTGIDETTVGQKKKNQDSIVCGLCF